MGLTGMADVINSDAKTVIELVKKEDELVERKFEVKFSIMEGIIESSFTAFVYVEGREWTINVIETSGNPVTRMPEMARLTQKDFAFWQSVMTKLEPYLA